MSVYYEVTKPHFSRTCTRCGWAPDTACQCRRTGRTEQRVIAPRTAQPRRSSEPAWQREHLRRGARLRALMPADPTTRLRYLDAKRDWQRTPMTWLEAHRRLEELRRDTPVALRNPAASARPPRTPPTRWDLD